MSSVARTDLPDTRPLYGLIHRTRRLLRSSWVATGAGLTLGLLLGTLVVLTALDVVTPLRPWTWTVGGKVVPMDGIVRLIALLLVVIPATWAFAVGVVRPMCRRLAAQHVARRIEQHLPGIHNRLVSSIDLDRKDRPPVSPVFHRRLLTEALERIRSFRPRMVLDGASLRKAVVFAFVATIAFGGLYAAASSRLPRAIERLFLPFADLPPVTGVAYDVQPGNADVLREEPIVFDVKVTSDADPQDLHLELYNDTGKPFHTFDLKPDRQDPKVWHAVVDGASLGAGYEDGFRYRVFGGETWSKQYRMRLVERPVIVSVQNAVYCPDYMGIKEPTLAPPQATEITGPEGGSVEVVVQAQGEVASGEVQLLKPGIKAISAHLQSERTWFDDKLPFGATAEGTWSWERLKSRSGHTEPVAIGMHGHWFRDDPVGHAVTPGDVLFAYVHIDSQSPPASILLEYNDGDTWEHRAFWGVSNNKALRKDGPAQRHMGNLPVVGQWVRLEVPAYKVGLEGKTLRGMAFKTDGGRCWWGRAGTVQTEEAGVERIAGFPMKQIEDGRWAGRFPLTGTGLFRAELKNAQGHPNKPMKEIKYVALEDKPPQVVIERQGSETVLAKPAAVPVTVSAYDDYGLEEIRLLVREGDVGEYHARVIKHFGSPERTSTVVDLLAEASKLKQGGQLWYMAEAVDRKKQTARTREYVIRIAADANAADNQLEAFEKEQDPFKKKLIDLIAQQKKIQADIEKVNKEYAPVAERVQAAMNDVKPPDKTGTDPKAPQPPQQAPKLDPELAKKYAELQTELARLGKQEEDNANLAQQIAKDLEKQAEQAGKLDLLPKQIANEMKATTQAFQDLVADAMRNLGQEMTKDSAPNQTKAPDLPGMKNKGDRIAKELEDAKSRLDALADARKKSGDDVKAALDQLRRELMELDGKLTARELQELRDYIAKLREQLKGLQDREANLEKNAENGEDLADLKRKQEDIEKEIEKMLAKAKELLDAKKKAKDRRPEFPDSPYDPDRETVKVPPREEDTNDPLPGEKKGKPGDKDPDKKGDKKDMEDDDKEPLYMPALGGKREKEDPRFAGKKRPVKKRKPMPGEKPDPSEDRKDLEDQARDNERNLDNADKALGSDQKSLEDMLRDLESALKSSPSQKGKNGQQGEADQLAEQLRQMMQSEAMKQARAMAGRMKSSMKGQQPGQQQQPSASNNPNANGNDQRGSKEADLSKLDPDTRAMLLKLPPSKLRDELIQGMSEQGPEAYRAFIQDYFKRLTETKK